MAAAAAAAVVIFSLGTWVNGEGPSAHEVTAESVRAYYSENELSLRLLSVSTALVAVSWLLLVAAIARIARRIAPFSSLGSVVLVSGAVFSMQLLLFAAVAGPSVIVDPEAISDEVLLNWYSMVFVEEYLGDLVVFVRALLLGAVAILAWRTGMLPRWLTALTGFLAVCCLVGGMTFVIAGVVSWWKVFGAFWFIGTFGMNAWPLPLSVVLFVRWRRARRATAVTHAQVA